MSVRTVLFLCTGNYYRSRFAEVLFNHLAGQLRPGWRACSGGLGLAGTETLNPGPISVHALEAFAQRSIPLPEPISFPRAVTLEDLASADVIVALKETEHRPLIRRLFPEWETRIAYWNIHDVDEAPPESALAEIEALVRNLIARL